MIVSLLSKSSAILNFISTKQSEETHNNILLAKAFMYINPLRRNIPKQSHIL